MCAVHVQVSLVWQKSLLAQALHLMGTVGVCVQWGEHAAAPASPKGDPGWSKICVEKK